MRPKFKVGDPVFHVGAARRGVVKDVFFDGEQPRYYVQHSGWIWGVPESSLRARGVAKSASQVVDSTEGENAENPGERDPGQSA
jgi:hypothetical protein